MEEQREQITPLEYVLRERALGISRKLSGMQVANATAILDRAKKYVSDGTVSTDFDRKEKELHECKVRKVPYQTPTDEGVMVQEAEESL
jgi:hypothetical protein